MSILLRIRDSRTEGSRLSPGPGQVKFIGYMYGARRSRARPDGRGITPARPRV